MLAQPIDWTGRLAAAAAEAGQGGAPFPADMFADAPDDVRAIAAGIIRMDHALAEQTAALSEARERRQAMALEMNHRIRNNLQIIGSFLNIQAEGLPLDCERVAIERARLRVAAVGLVHRLIFDRGDQTTVSSGQLINAICALITDAIDTRLGFDIDCRADQHLVPIDTAVPLALWAVEAVEVIAMRGSKAPDAGIAVRLKIPDEQLELAVAGSGLGAPVAADAMADRLLEALARQMGSQLVRRRPADDEEELSLHVFLNGAEQHSP